MGEYNLKENEYGFLELYPYPSSNDLKKYYEDKYYQEGEGTYSNDYTLEEKEYLNNRIKEKEYILKQYLEIETGTLLDIGCGEGWVLSYFYRKGWSVEGFDFSKYGIEQHNKMMLKYFCQGDIFSLGSL